MRWQLLIPLLVLLGLGALFASRLGEDPGLIPSPLIDQPLPSFTLQTLDAPPQTVSSDDLRGKPFLLNVWGSWCAFCADEHGFLMQLARNRVIDIYGFNWKDERDAATQWLADLGNPYVLSVVDQQGSAAIDLGVYGAPETFLVDANGIVVHKFVGPLDAASWQQEFAPRLATLGGDQ